MRTLLTLALMALMALVRHPALAQGHGAAAAPQALQVTLRALAAADAGAPLTFQLLATNRGGTSVQLIRPRAGMLERNAQWGGWSVEVEGPRGRASPQAVPGAVPPFTARDLIELRPGESIGVVFSLRHWVVPRQPRTAAPTAIAELPGPYTVVVRYRLDPGWVPGADGSSAGAITVPTLPPAGSAPLRFVVSR